MQRIIILNPKGGSGKTTLATNLAGNFAASGHRPALMDLDPQASSMRWLSQRPDGRAPVHGIPGFERTAGVTRTWQLRVPRDCNALIIDTPAGAHSRRLMDLTRDADIILIPVMPSDIDTHAAAKCIADLLLVAKIRRADDRIGILANRVRSNTRISRALMRFLRSLEIPLVATLRDTQNYVRAAQSGLGIYELPRWRVRKDLEAWQTLFGWLDERRGLHAQPGGKAAGPS